MKFTKILALVIALISVLSMLVACDMGDGNETPAPVGPVETVRYKALVHVKVVNWDGKVVYETEEEEPYEYDSGYSEPYIFTFLEDFAFMNSKEFAYKAKKSKESTNEAGESIAVSYTLESISITQKKKTKTYKAGDQITSKYDGSEQSTYWVVYVNGEEIKDMNGYLIKDQDVVEFRLAYANSHLITSGVETLPDLDATEPPASETDAPAA